MREIEKHLTNHVTGTEGKIEKLDDNFKHLNIRLDSAFSFNHQKANFLKEKNLEKPIK